MVLPTPSDLLFKWYEQTILHFIWNGEPDKMKRASLYNKSEFGGQKWLNIKALDLSLKALVQRNFIDMWKQRWFNQWGFPPYVLLSDSSQDSGDEQEDEDEELSDEELKQTNAHMICPPHVICPVSPIEAREQLPGFNISD